ncbi:MAG: HAMP domain-containing sensor histidine kinase [Pseudomonadota bacterium]
MSRPLFSRLYVRIYATLLVSVVVAAILFVILHFGYSPMQRAAGLETMGEVVAQVLPPPEVAQEQQQRALWKLRSKVQADLALYDAARRYVASSGRPMPALDPAQMDSGWMDGHPAVFVVKLPDGRWLLSRRNELHRASMGLLMLMVFIAVVVAVGAYPVVRRLTGRLERLQASVQAWGTGELSARVAVEGRDEVAQLASSFNDSAARIEALVAAQRNLLANASHELRSPLARIRMAVELMPEAAGGAFGGELKRNIGELDQLIDELLLASRLDAASGVPPAQEVVDLTAIAAEECARVAAHLDAAQLTVPGDARLLRRLVRNLLENAQRYGAGSAVEVRLARMDGKAVLEVCDGGPGVAPEQREQIFTPFYRVPGASEAAGGVGLGLALVRQIALHHGGDVRCVQNEPAGCCFRVTLPA